MTNRKGEIGPAMRAILVAVRDEPAGSLTLARLCELAGFGSKSGASTSVYRLREGGYVTNEPGNLSTLCLTAKGRREIADAANAVPVATRTSAPSKAAAPDITSPAPQPASVSVAPVIDGALVLVLTADEAQSELGERLRARLVSLPELLRQAFDRLVQLPGMGSPLPVAPIARAVAPKAKAARAKRAKVVVEADDEDEDDEPEGEPAVDEDADEGTAYGARVDEDESDDEEADGGPIEDDAPISRPPAPGPAALAYGVKLKGQSLDALSSSDAITMAEAMKVSRRLPGSVVVRLSDGKAMTLPQPGAA